MQLPLTRDALIEYARRAQATGAIGSRLTPEQHADCILQGIRSAESRRRARYGDEDIMPRNAERLAALERRLKEQTDGKRE